MMSASDFANVGPRKEAEWQHALAAGNGSMKTVWHCHKMFGPNLILNGLVLAVSVCNIIASSCIMLLYFDFVLLYFDSVLCNYSSHAFN